MRVILKINSTVTKKFVEKISLAIYKYSYINYE